MEEKFLFEVENMISVPQQWLRAGDIFEVYQTATRKNYFELRLNRRAENKNFNNFSHCYLSFKYEGDLENKEEILKAIKFEYSKNTFALVNALNVELI